MKVAINGLGRIGRAALKIILDISIFHRMHLSFCCKFQVTKHFYLGPSSVLLGIGGFI